MFCKAPPLPLHEAVSSQIPVYGSVYTMDSIPSQAPRSVRFRNVNLGPADTITIEFGEDIVISFDKATTVPFPVPDEEVVRCWTCNRLGHFSRQCLSGPSPLHGSCYECGLPGHQAWACPIPAGLSPCPLSDTYVCNIHNKPRGYLNIMKDELGGWRCKPDSECQRF